MPCPFMGDGRSSVCVFVAEVDTKLVVLLVCPSKSVADCFGSVRPKSELQGSGYVGLGRRGDNRNKPFLVLQRA